MLFRSREFCEMFFQFNSLSDGNTAILAHLTNLSLKDKGDERITLSIRINNHPVFNEYISHNIAVAVIGFCPTATKNPVFIPENVILTHGQPEPTTYEQQIEAVFHQLEHGQYPKRGSPNLLTPEIYQISAQICCENQSSFGRSEEHTSELQSPG